MNEPTTEELVAMVAERAKSETLTPARPSQPPRPPMPDRVESHARDTERLERADRASKLADYRRSVGKRYAQCTLDTYTIQCEEQTSIVTTLREYGKAMGDNVTRGRGIVLHGPSGTGKDHLLIGLGAIAVAMGRKARAVDIVRVVSGMDLFGLFRQAIKDDSEQQTIRSLIRPQILIIQDPVSSTESLTDYQEQVLQRVVDTRYRDLRPIWVSLNSADKPHAIRMLGEPVVDRLWHDSIVRRCGWATHRKDRR